MAQTFELPASTANAMPGKWPEVRGHWIMGNLRALQRMPLELYHQAWKRHGDYIRFRAIPGYWWYLISHPAAIEHVLQTAARNYRKPDMFYNSVSTLAGDGILTSEGDLWRRQRKLVQPVFARHQVSRLGSHITDGVASLLDQWDRQSDGRTLDILPEMMRLGLRIISTALFSTDISSDADSIGRAYRTAFEYVSMKFNGRFLASRWVPTRTNRQFAASKALLDRVVLELITNRRRGSPDSNVPAGDTPAGAGHAPDVHARDLLDRLLAAQDDETGHGMSDQQLKDEVITLLTAGHETAGAALSWAWYLLAAHPEVQESLHDESHGHLQGRMPQVVDLPSLPLATAVFEETMRLYPPAWGVPRESIEADDIQNYPLPAKSTLVVSQYIAQRHPDFWPNPEQFDPRRFLPGGNDARPKFAFFPFGGGPRVCVGNHFAMLEGPLALAALVQKYHFTLVPGQQIVADPTFTLRPRHGVQMVLRRRS